MEDKGEREKAACDHAPADQICVSLVQGIVMAENDKDQQSAGEEHDEQAEAL